MKDYTELFENKRILVTGGTGSIGSRIVKQLLPYSPRVIRILSRDETKQYYLQNELSGSDNLRFLIGDIRDKERLRLAVKDIDIIFHAAALKHVPSCEYNPFEAVKTNVIGTQNLIELCLSEGIGRMTVISTDKATNPINVMGVTKLLSERLVAAAHYFRQDESPIMSCVRFGNVIGSNGSVVPLFIRQLKRDRTITVTDPDMTRFVMSISDAITLVLKATQLAKGGEIFILKMPTVKISVLAKAVIEMFARENNLARSSLKMKIVGIRQGEKRHELLLSREEAELAHDIDDMYILNTKNNGNGNGNGNGRKHVPIKLPVLSSEGQPSLSEDDILTILQNSTYDYS